MKRVLFVKEKEKQKKRKKNVVMRACMHADAFDVRPDSMYAKSKMN